MYLNAVLVHRRARPRAAGRDQAAGVVEEEDGGCEDEETPHGHGGDRTMYPGANVAHSKQASNERGEGRGGVAATN